MGSESAAVRLGVPSYFNLLFTATVLLLIGAARVRRGAP